MVGRLEMELGGEEWRLAVNHPATGPLELANSAGKTFEIEVHGTDRYCLDSTADSGSEDNASISSLAPYERDRSKTPPASDFDVTTIVEHGRCMDGLFTQMGGFAKGLIIDTLKVDATPGIGDIQGHDRYDYY